MAGDFNKPASSSTKAGFMTEIRDMFSDLAKMVFTSTSNIPTGCIRLNETTHLFEKYNGATWATLDLTGLNVGSVIGKVPSATPGANNIPVLDANGDYYHAGQAAVIKNIAAGFRQIGQGRSSGPLVGRRLVSTRWPRIANRVTRRLHLRCTKHEYWNPTRTSPASRV